MPSWRSTLVFGATALVAVMTAAGCSRDDGRFDAGESGEITCMEHQSEEPGSAYTGGSEADTAAVLAVLRYYVENGSKPYCDGDPPTDTDRAWAQLVVDLGGSAASVASILDAD